MNEWRVLQFNDEISEYDTFWAECGNFETEHSWLGDADVQRLGQQHGTGTYMLLPTPGLYEPRIELTIGARQTFYTVTDEDPEVPVEVPASLEAVLDPRD